MKNRVVCVTFLAIGLLVCGFWRWVQADEEQTTASSNPTTEEATPTIEPAEPAATPQEGGSSTGSTTSAATSEQTAGAPSTSAAMSGQTEATPSTETTTSGEATGETPVTAITPNPEGLISVDFKDADIRQVLRIISLKAGVDIVAGTDVEGLVTIKLSNVPWEQALDIILRTYGFTYERKDRIVRVLTVAALEKEALSTEVFPLDYAKAKEVPDVIKEMMSERGKVKFDERTNTIIVTDVPSSLFKIKQVIARLDQRTPQVLIDSKIIETKLEKNESLGIDWSTSFKLTQTMPTFTSSFPFPQGSGLGSFGTAFLANRIPQRQGGTAVTLGTLKPGDLVATLQFLQSRTDTHIVSNPSISALNNQEAKIHIGEEYPIPNYTIDPTTGKTTISGYTSKNIGTVLTVTPHVNPSNEIVVDLKPEVTTAGTNVDYQTGGSGGEKVSLPRFVVQSAQTQVRIRNGETITIGGLVKETSQRKVSKVPILGDIPLLGIFFSSASRDQGVGGSDPSRQDLIIFLTVKTMEESSTKGHATAGVAPSGQAVASAVPSETPYHP